MSGEHKHSAEHKHKEHHEEKKALQNRELSWLQFNARIQDEADNLDNPLLERAKFLAIVSSNMDEFLQVRYHTVLEKGEKKKEDAKKTMGGITPHKLYKLVNKEIQHQYNRQYVLFDGIRGEMYQQKIRIFPAFFRDEVMAAQEKKIFMEQILPQLKVEHVKDEAIKQKQLYLCVKLAHAKGKHLPFRLIALPTSLPRLYNLSEGKPIQCIIRLEDIVKHYIQQLFPKEIVEHISVFRVLRNQDFEVVEKTQEEIVPAVRKMLEKRSSGKVMRIDAEEGMSEEMLTLLMKLLDVDQERVYRALGPLDLNKLMMMLYSMVKRPDLQYDSVKPLPLPELMGDDIFEKIEQHDRLMFHPYHSFEPVLHLIRHASEDPEVTAIKMVLYRVSGNSPIVAALTQAAENGKQVFVLFEAHARFDEENNLFWGEKLQRSGCKVLYGVPNLKVHSKILLIERKNGDEIRRIVHLGTGNYHDGTAKLYTDFGLLTANPELCADADLFFRQFAGEEVALNKLRKSPDQMQPRLMQMIENEKQNALEGKPARILAKMNSINDKKMLFALIDAAKAGVQVDLLVRGICCVFPGKQGLTENLRVRSIVGRNLEHARAFLFENGGDHQVFLASADWMGRNLYKRIELMFPVLDPECRAAVENVLNLQWNDTEKCRHCRKNGEYVLHRIGIGGINAQEIMLHDIQGVFAGTNPVFERITSREAERCPAAEDEQFNEEVKTEEALQTDE